MKIKLLKKFADRNIDEFINKIYLNHKTNPTDSYQFDLTEVEFIGNQELLVLSALLKSFKQSNIDFEVIFFKKGIFPSQINLRVKRQIIQFWEVWKIWKIVPDDECIKYFGIDGNSVGRLQQELNYFPKLSEIYSRHGVTPFVSLDFINNYDETEVQKLISPIYKLNSIVEDLLKKNKCYHPFTSNSLSTIITEELYLNFLDHSLSSSFSNLKRFAFMSISFRPKLEEAKLLEEEIQNIKALNFETECLDETINFFYDSKAKKFKNTPYIEFSFLDFGQGIVNTLQEQYKTQDLNNASDNLDSDVLFYSFNHNSSRHPLFNNKNKLEQFIPRGLFDVLTIVRRYKGLLVVRSNYGKILFDFSNNSDAAKAHSYFGDKSYYFPGTLISLYIPAIEDASNLNISSIKPEISFSVIKPLNKKYVNISSIVERLNVGKVLLYSTLLGELKKAICNNVDNSLVFISFKGFEIEKRIIKKTIYFLLSDYDINHRNNVVVLNSPPLNIIDEIASEILMLNDAIKNYKLHPLPIIDFEIGSENINIKWLGIYDDSDKDKLKDLLYEQYSIVKSDFNDPGNISGHLSEFDSYGNLISNFPNRSEILGFYRKENEILASKEIERLLLKHNCIKKDTGTSLYLCNGNYYQKEYIELNNLVNDKHDCKEITQILFERIKSTISVSEDYKFIGVTATSQKILKSIQAQGLISSSDFISLDNYHTFENDLNTDLIDISKKYILVCDVISTGHLTNKISNKLIQLGTTIEYIAVVASTLDIKFESTKSFQDEFDKKIIYLYEYPISKFKRKDIKKEIIAKDIIRINPHTNIPITLSINQTNFNDSIIFHSTIDYHEENNEIVIENEFLNSIKSELINVGFYKFNNVIHPYFFNTDLILREINEETLKKIFSKINKENLKKEKLQIFYPRKSGIESFNFSLLKKVLNNHLLEEIEIERFGTTEGWRFPHNTDYLSAKIENNICFILDDGSCSGDSLIQMIDEISFYEAKEIILLSFIGRVNDHKREFFSRLTGIKVKDNKSIPLAIYFACHWHIPTYYIDENPTTKEITWLQDLTRLQNIPQSIKKIVTVVSNEITPKTSTNFIDYKYLPKFHDSRLIPKKDLLLIREELGKAIGYRLYKESFKFFDCFIKKYEKRIDSKDRYKEIELLCATFIYEPYLYEKMIGVLPDVVEKIEEFVRVLIFSDQVIYESLTYKWDKKDIVHLFFIVFKNEKLLKELDQPNFRKLITFTEPKESALNYVLYKLLNYFPIKDIQLKEKKFDTSIKELLVKLKSENSNFSKEIRKYYNFISTLPSREDFNSQLSVLMDNYNKQKEPEFHIDKISFGHNISLIVALIRESISNIEEGKLIEKEKIEKIIDRWFEILNFINPILSFSLTFKNFLLPFPYLRLLNKVESGNSSLRGMVGFNEDIIFALKETFNDVDKLKQLVRNILLIQSDFKVDSDFYNLISEPTSSLRNLIDGLYKGIKSLSKGIEPKDLNLIDIKYYVNIPKVYSEILIKNEILTNLKNHAQKGKEEQVIFECSKPSATVIELKMTNLISDLAFNNSNGEGIKCLMLLSDDNLFGFNYKSKTEGKKFIQTLTFKIKEYGY